MLRGRSGRIEDTIPKVILVPIFYSQKFEIRSTGGWVKQKLLKDLAQLFE